jgi:hypothetical protein
MNQCKLVGTMKLQENGLPYKINKFNVDVYNEGQKTGEKKEVENFSGMLVEGSDYYPVKFESRPTQEDVEVMLCGKVSVTATYSSQYNKEKNTSFSSFKVQSIKPFEF